MEFDELYTFESSLNCLKALKLLQITGMDITDYNENIFFNYGEFFEIAYFVFSYAIPKLFKDFTVFEPDVDVTCIREKEKVLHQFGITDYDSKTIACEYILLIRDHRLKKCYQIIDASIEEMNIIVNSDKDALLFRIHEDYCMDFTSTELLESFIEYYNELEKY